MSDSPIYQSLLDAIASYEHTTPYNILEDMVKTFGEEAVFAALVRILVGSNEAIVLINAFQTDSPLTDKERAELNGVVRSCAMGTLRRLFIERMS